MRLETVCSQPTRPVGSRGKAQPGARGALARAVRSPAGSRPALLQPPPKAVAVPPVAPPPAARTTQPPPPAPDKVVEIKGAEQLLQLLQQAEQPAQQSGAAAAAAPAPQAASQASGAAGAGKRASKQPPLSGGEMVAADSSNSRSSSSSAANAVAAPQVPAQWPVTKRANRKPREQQLQHAKRKSVRSTAAALAAPPPTPAAAPSPAAPKPSPKKQERAKRAQQPGGSQQAGQRQQAAGSRQGNRGNDRVAAGRGAGSPQRPQAKRPGMKKPAIKKPAITPKESDLKRWYADATRAAELAMQQAGPEAAAAPAVAAYTRTLLEPMQGWLDERLDNMGFPPSRPFPELKPLNELLSSSEEQQREASSSSSSSSSRAGSSGHGAEGAASSRGAPGQGSGPAAHAAPATSCTSSTFARWAEEAGGDLPLLASQYHNSHSWDLREATARLLHESHAGHGWSGTSEEHAQAMIGLYEELARDVAGLPVVAGRAPRNRSLPGAAGSFTLEAMVGNGRALQVASSHNLADNYSRLLGTPFRDSDGEEQFLSQMGSGLQASLLSGVVLVHGDDAGVRLPPSLAPVQVMIVPVWHSRQSSALEAEVERIRGTLAQAGVRVAVDARRCWPGVRFGAAERQGVPLRIEVGPRDVRTRTCVIARRDAPGPGGKLANVSTDPEALVATVRGLLEDAQSELQWRAAAALETEVVDVGSFYELKDAIEAGKWARGPWAGSLEDEAAIFDETGAALRCFPLQQPVSMWSGYSTCLYSGYQATEVAIFARGL